MTKTQNLALGAVIAAIYAAIAIFLAPISFGPMQLRVSEALTVLPFLFPAAVPGLYIGCFLANFAMSPLGVWDWTVGALATLLAAWLTYLLGRYVKGRPGFWLAPLPPVVVNALIIGALLRFTSGADGAPLWVYMLDVARGQIAACYVLGLPLLYFLQKSPFIKERMRRKTGSLQPNKNMTERTPNP
jgi:uncharacterized membrane protein